ncbi:MAG: deoxyribonuclease IV [Deltaproteobacteria bacterium]|nr:deoxyribonuclease IV [Deltaproteobacteria bacterium]MBI4795779.1 deoxyribonuclease IV [Deltaproteobacteria bacterium]
MRLGFHLSIAGSLLRAVKQAEVLGCQALQIFIQNPRAWKWRPLPRSEIDAFVAARRIAGLGPLAVHLTYLPNLASVDPVLCQKSRERLIQELALARDLEADYLICHPGHAPLETESFQRVARTLAAAVDQIPPPPLVLIENTAGQGQELGWSQEQLGLIMRLAGVPLGLCLDTSHAFGAGYDLRHPAGVARLLGETARGPGLDRIKIIHLNDSRAPLGSRRDRHAHLGQGAIGLKGFRQFFAHPWLRPEAAIMETPKRHQADEWRNLLAARSLITTPALPFSRV